MGRQRSASESDLAAGAAEASEQLRELGGRGRHLYVWFEHHRDLLARERRQSTRRVDDRAGVRQLSAAASDSREGAKRGQRPTLLSERVNAADLICLGTIARADRRWMDSTGLEHRWRCALGKTPSVPPRGGRWFSRMTWTNRCGIVRRGLFSAEDRICQLRSTERH